MTPAASGLPTVEEMGHAEGHKFYHTGESQRPDYNRKTFRRNKPAETDREVIAWDMEGISLSGQNRPQHPVLFGCSAELDAPLVGERLTSRAMLDYILDVAERHPYAIHVGFGFKYDANMLIFGLTKFHITQLWKDGKTRWRWDDYYYNLRLVPGKMFVLSRRPSSCPRNSRAKTSVTIYDYASFFGTTFIKATEQILGSELTDDDREVIAHGKRDRGTHATMESLPEIRHYWSREIVLMRRVFERFREVMWRAGFGLTEWYGPGALANYINATKGIRPKLAGVQKTSECFPDGAHEASKVAFSGGRFELFQAGRIRGPVYAVDINSAYPYALTQLPSFEHGRWVHSVAPDSVRRFGIYRISYRSPSTGPFEYVPQPLFWRDHRGMISYPGMVHGWYYSPEAAMARGMPGVTIHEAWEWETESEERPWSFLTEMYSTRMRLGKKNLLSMPFKLGPNSLYGKYAQTVGWDQEKKLPPKSHALPVAGWVTSYCRAMLWKVIRQCPSTVVAVETDSVFTTTDPTNLDISLGDALGEWSYDVYDELLYLQNGMYHTRKGDEWQGVKSRGISAREFPIALAEDYLAQLTPGESWNPMELPTRPRFIGAGAALSSSLPFRDNFTSWRSQTRLVGIGDTGKRIHNSKTCSQCRDGLTPNETPHRLLVHSRSNGQTLSFPRRLPWEQQYTKEVQEMRTQLEIESEMVVR